MFKNAPFKIAQILNWHFRFRKNDAFVYSKRALFEFPKNFCAKTENAKCKIYGSFQNKSKQDQIVIF